MNNLFIRNVAITTLILIGLVWILMYVSQRPMIKNLTEQIELIKTANEINKTAVNEYLKKSEAIEKELSEIKSKINNWSNSELPSEFSNLFNKNKKDFVPNCKIPTKE